MKLVRRKRARQTTRERELEIMAVLAQTDKFNPAIHLSMTISTLVPSLAIEIQCVSSIK